MNETKRKTEVARHVQWAIDKLLQARRAIVDGRIEDADACIQAAGSNMERAIRVAEKEQGDG